MDLPCKECGGKCCQYPAFTKKEFKRAKKRYGIPANSHTMEMRDGGQILFLPGGTCPYLIEGVCSIYKHRPQVCKDYGIVPELPCQYLYPERAEKRAKRKFTGFVNKL